MSVNALDALKLRNDLQSTPLKKAKEIRPVFFLISVFEENLQCGFRFGF